MIRAIKTLRELETIGTLPNLTETTPTIASQTLMGLDLITNELRKSHNELNNKKRKNKHANTRMHGNFSQVKEAKEIFEDSQAKNNPKPFALKLL
ncbi:hypothetical protein VN1171_06390 [Helicobacter pylori]|nr:hypothetical protein VN1171_06390 [Helicobacter pylori]